MTKFKTCITYAAYCTFIFALTFFGPYHGWKYGLVFFVGVTVAMWLVLTFVSDPLAEETERDASAAKQAENVARWRDD